MPVVRAPAHHQPDLHVARRRAARRHRPALSASAIDFDITIGVDNPNNVGLRLDRLDFDLSINDKPILTSVRADQGIRIPAHGFGEVHLRTRVAYANIRTIFRQIADIVQGERAHYTIHGEAWYHTPFGPLRYPLTLYSR